ncbi:hypothetical protein BT63DRAFT_306553 [Microthyrium microscopicum]|uniref:BTB domain-containing protein n=1 Tax=Microthyrium microscopicum TaxID=703497 RepID=A0A6A6U8Q2_9PEZI|nr:hypothetical protein BT63DRAFT_306553 [Microthyrium microscopicum]
MIQVTIGQEGDTSCHTFTVPKDLLASDSEYFRGMFRHNFKEVNKGVVNMPDVHPATFQMYLEYLYSGKIFSKDIQGEIEGELEAKEYTDKARKGQDIDPEFEAHCKEKLALINAICLADYLQSDGFHNASIDILIEICEEKDDYFPDWAVVMIVDSCVPLLVRLAQDFIIHAGWGEWFTDRESLPDRCLQFFLQVVGETTELLSLTGRPFQPPWETDRCRYHRHGMD